MYRISKEKLVSFNSNQAIVECELWASSSNDLPAYNSMDGKIIAPGSVAVIPSESKIYVLDFDNAWKEWGEEGSDEA